MVEATRPDADAAIHTLAVSISRELNLLNPNDLLARRMLDLARQNKDSLHKFQAAASTFGRFTSTFLQEVWMDAQADKFTAAGAKAAETPLGGALPNGNGVHHHDGNGRLVIGNLVIEDSEVMMPAKPQPGGLVKPSMKSGGSQEHVFRAPPTPRSSELGLDRLAAEKRRERTQSASESESEREGKRSRYDSGEDSNDSDSGPLFKSEPTLRDCRAELTCVIL